MCNREQPLERLGTAADTWPACLVTDGGIERVVLSGWGRFPQVDSAVIQVGRSPGTPIQRHGFPHFVARGLGRSYGDASLPTADGLALDMSRRARILGFDEQSGLLTAESGVSLSEILEVIVPRGWFLPVTPGTKHVSLGGAIAANVHGKNHHRAGAIHHHLRALSILTESGLVDCRPETHPELFLATVGGFGMTGVILDATLQLRRVTSSAIRLSTHRARDLSHLLRLLREGESKHEYAIAWVDTMSQGRRLGRGLAMFGDHLPAQDVSSLAAEQALPWQPGRPFSMRACPIPAPVRRLAQTCVSKAYFHFSRTGERLVPFDSYFYPLDRVAAWNRCYGSTGFSQYQCVIPHDQDAERAVQRLLEKIAQSRAGAFVAGIKSMQSDQVMLPFGMEGISLGIDFDRAIPRIDGVMNQLDDIVVAHGGRVALSKDSRLSPAMFRQMYPEFGRWIAAVREHSPTRLFYSRMADRLEWR